MLPLTSCSHARHMRKLPILKTIVGTQTDSSRQTNIVFGGICQEILGRLSPHMRLRYQTGNAFFIGDIFHVQRHAPIICHQAHTGVKQRKAINVRLMFLTVSQPVNRV